jgi:hypothetical protein
MKDESAAGFLTGKNLFFLLMLLGLIGCAILRSGVATRLDSFNIDEAYHIGAGTAYVQTGDFRLNPEHPPLVKLWVGAFVASRGFQLSPYRAFADKADERDFVETDVYINNNPDAVQSRARTAMFVLNGLLLFMFAVAARRLFGDVMALAATAFLAIDPTVAAHFPVVMTDLPVALLSSTAVLLAVTAFRSWRALDLVFTGVVLGLALSAKHSAVITLAAVAMIGVTAAIFLSSGANLLTRLRRVGAVAAVLVGAVILLWTFYLFRYSESPETKEQQFNRPLADKIADVKSPLYRAGLNLMADGHFFPRAYTWGMADTIRAGAEGNASSILLFGNLYYSKGPFYYFPGVIAVKLPLGLLLLTLLGTGLLLARRAPPEWHAPLLAVVVLAILFLLALMKGSSYAGIRHALPVVPSMALLGGLAIYQAVKSKSYILRGAVAVAIVGALVSAVPVMRPWEYYNEIVGGQKNGHLYFSDEGVDLGLRTKELAAYYNQNLKPTGEIPYVVYFSPYLEKQRRGVDFVGNDPERDMDKMAGDVQSGTFIIGAKEMAPSLFWDVGQPFREAAPVARFGNLFVFRGTFSARAAQSASLFFRGVGKIYAPEPDVEGGIEMMKQSAALDPTPFFVWLELGNQYLKIGNRDEALKAYRMAQEKAPVSNDIRELLERQVERMQIEPLEQIQPVRNPVLE